MYRVVADITVIKAAAALPDDALAAYVRVLDALEVLPWNGESQQEDNPEGAVRRWRFGADHAGLWIRCYLAVCSARM